ncbi:MAG TPA: CbiX/SirB N-terminal domain-containing protein [Bryobacteraceae bacterium]|nr:CbiX/SirB N-terminal domain-containing protein [Bryobacteraceae bacterium]
MTRKAARGFIIFAHGSRIESANEGVRAIAAGFAGAGNFPHVEAAFLELGQPDLGSAVGRLANRGVRQIVVIPYFLTLGLHLERDLPALVARLMAEHPGLEIRVTKPLEGHPALLDILLDRAGEASEDPEPPAGPGGSAKSPTSSAAASRGRRRDRE